MDSSRIEKINHLLGAMPPEYLDEVIEYMKYLSFKSQNQKDDFFNGSNSELLNRTEASLEDIKNGDTQNIVDFKEEVKEWMKKKAI